MTETKAFEAVSDLFFCYVCTGYPETCEGEDLNHAAQDFIGMLTTLGVELWEDYEIDEEALVMEWNMRNEDPQFTEIRPAFKKRNEDGKEKESDEEGSEEESG